MFKFLRRNKKEPANLKEVQDYLRKLDGRIDALSQDLDKFKKDSRSFVQKVGLVRFNPFKETGGDQSFVITLLDAENNGFVITSLYTRDGNRIFAKPVDGGCSKYPLSEEEKEAIAKAIQVKT